MQKQARDLDDRVTTWLRVNIRDGLTKTQQIVGAALLVVLLIGIPTTVGVAQGNDGSSSDSAKVETDVPTRPLIRRAG